MINGIFLIYHNDCNRYFRENYAIFKLTKLKKVVEIIYANS